MPSYNRIAYCYKLFLKKEWGRMKSFYEENNFDVFLPHTHLGDTSLHLAVYSGDKKLMRTLLQIVYKKVDDPIPDQVNFPLHNAYGNTPLHEAASLGNVDMVQILMEYDRKLLKCKNLRGETPFFMAALYGKTKVIQHLVKEVEKLDYGESQEKVMAFHVRSETSSMLHEAIRGYYFDTALELVKPRYHIDTDWKDNFDGMTCFQLLANIPSAFKSGHSFGILEKLIYLGLQVPEDQDGRENNNVAQVTPSPKTDSKLGFPSVQSLREMKKKHSIVEKLSKILAEKDMSWDPSQTKKDKSRDGDNTTDGQSDTPLIAAARNTTDGQKDTPLIAAARNTTDGQKDTPLIAAARNGITEIVKDILDAFPQAIEHENHKKENVFHFAVENRRKNVLDLLQYSYNLTEPRLIWKFDVDGDGILHKAAYKSEYSPRDRPGEALRLQSDIQWFQRVKKMVPPHHINHLNKKKLTPHALFTKEHNELVKSGQEWLIRTTNSCIIVAVLIATVAFTSIYTVPGGSHPKTGKPLLLNTTAFTVFTASDVASLCFAFTSVVVFLSITTSKMNEQDFRRSLPLKLVLGLSMLFLSVAALMVGFAATLDITIRHRLHQAAAPIIAIACFPVAFFLFLQLPLYTNITWFTIKDLLRSLTDFIPHQKCKVLWLRHVLSYSHRTA